MGKLTKFYIFLSDYYPKDTKLGFLGSRAFMKSNPYVLTLQRQSIGSVHMFVRPFE